MAHMSAIKAFIAGLLLASSAATLAQSNFQNSIEFSSPPVVGEPITVTLNYVGDSCNAKSANATLARFSHLVILNFDPNLGCFKVVTQHRIVLQPTTFAFAGSHQIEIVGSNGGRYGSYEFSVQGKFVPFVFNDPENEKPYSDFNVGGLWYEPATSGTGLFLEHKKYQQVDIVFGSWLNYTDSGRTSWYFLSGLSWTSARVNKGDIYKTSADPTFCFLPPPGSSCPMPLAPARATAVDKIGSYEIRFNSATTAEIRLSLSNGTATRLINLEKQ